MSTDDSSPVYTAFDDTSSLPDGAIVTYRAVLTYAPGKTVTSATRRAHGGADTGHRGGHPLQPARRRLRRLGAAPVRRRASPPGEATRRLDETPTPFEGTDDFGGLHEIGIADDTKRVGFIVHGRPPDGNPDVKDPDGVTRPLLQPARHTGDLAPAGRREDLSAARRPTPPAWCRRPPSAGCTLIARQTGGGARRGLSRAPRHGGIGAPSSVSIPQNLVVNKLFGTDSTARPQGGHAWQP